MKKIINLILVCTHRILFRIRYYKLHQYPLRYYVKRAQKLPRVDCKDRVVVTFTTIPERINMIDIMLKSMLDQTVLPDKIYLCIPEIFKRTQTKYNIPEWLKQIPLLKIITADKDYGPATKSIPGWLKERHNDNTRIITVDDDHVYSRYTIESLVAWSDKFPSAELGFKGTMVPKDYLPSDVMHGLKISLDKLCIASSPNINLLYKVDYLLGHAGVIFRAGFLNESILNYSEAPAEAFFDDDVWLGGHLDQANIDRLVIPTSRQRLMPKPCQIISKTTPLYSGENSSGANMDTTYKYLFKN